MDNLLLFHYYHYINFVGGDYEKTRSNTPTSLWSFMHKKEAKIVRGEEEYMWYIWNKEEKEEYKCAKHL